MLVFFIIVINTGGYIIRKIEKKKLYNREIKGYILEIRERRGGNNYFYNNNEYFTDDDFFEERYNTDVKIGDSVFKASNSNILVMFQMCCFNYK